MAESRSLPLYGGIEAGGTKFNCIIAGGPDHIVSEARFPTTTPQETLAQVIHFFRSAQQPLRAIGIGSFGPVDPDPASPTFGYITSTPKLAWQNTDFAGAIRRALNVPIAFDTDVNAAAFGEYMWGAARGLRTFVYYTIGTGIGGGGMAEGRLMHGLIHPEMGHVRLPHDWASDPFAGVCPFHGDCFEGLASGPAIAQRWGADPATLPPQHGAWQLEAHYIALAVVNTICVLSPQRIILGGGVMEQAFLFPMIRSEVQRLLNGYIVHRAILEDMDNYITPPALGGRAGVLGAVALAQRLAVSASS
ncbi:MAG: ROK family protein [Anaerolineae bacterium]|nr:ROK family protein [Anaerolineae bacterium]